MCTSLGETIERMRRAIDCPGCERDAIRDEPMGDEAVNFLRPVQPDGHPIFGRFASTRSRREMFCDEHVAQRRTSTGMGERADLGEPLGAEAGFLFQLASGAVNGQLFLVHAAGWQFRAHAVSHVTMLLDKQDASILVERDGRAGVPHLDHEVSAGCPVLPCEPVATDTEVRILVHNFPARYLRFSHVPAPL